MKPALLAGAAGGAAEILWIVAVSPTNADAVAREVTATLLPAAAGLAAAPLLGIAIHMVLSLGLGLILAKALLGVARAWWMGAALGVLAAVWALNFLVVLPALNPAFVALMPLSVTFASKLLFGATMGWTLLRRCPA